MSDSLRSSVQKMGGAMKALPISRVEADDTSETVSPQLFAIGSCALSIGENLREDSVFSKLCNDGFNTQRGDFRERILQSSFESPRFGASFTYLSGASARPWPGIGQFSMRHAT